MSGVPSSNYMSDASIMVWVAQQHERLYGDLQEAMSFAELRAQMASDAADLKQMLKDAAGDPTKLVALGDALEKFKADYGNIAEFGEVMETVNMISGNVAAQVQQQRTREAWEKMTPELGTLTPEEAQPVGPRGGPNAVDYSQIDLSEEPAVATALAQDTVDDWNKTLSDKIDASNQNEQVAMIHIGEIKSTIDQASNLASQVIKSGNDASSFIINNLAGEARHDQPSWLKPGAAVGAAHLELLHGRQAQPRREAAVADRVQPGQPGELR